jgi:hypothetical protein
MRRVGRRAAPAVLLAAALAGCGHGHASPAVTTEGDRDGLRARMTLTATGSSLVVETHLVNRRGRVVHVVPDQCGRITDVVLARTRFEPNGRKWAGSLGAVKRFILIDQRSRQEPDRFEPRPRGECVRPKLPIALSPGEAVDERRELPFKGSLALDAVGSAHSLVRTEVLEPRDPNEPEFLDMLPTFAAESARRGRALRLEVRAEQVVHRPPRSGARRPSLGQLYDRLLRNESLRPWLAAQPAGSWRSAQLLDLRSAIQFKAITALYERAAAATAQSDGGDVHVRLPRKSDRARTWSRQPGRPPPGIVLARDSHGWTLGDEITPSKLKLPSGRVAIGDYLDEPPLDLRAEPGAYPVRATLARYRRSKFANVAFATLVLSLRPTVRWHYARSFAVDSGTASITSAEAVSALRSSQHSQFSDEMFDSLVAHDSQVTEFDLGHGLNNVFLTSGDGDGNYPVFVGYDADGRPTRVVVDFLLLHLRWP